MQFNVGDRVRVKTSGKTGVVLSIHDSTTDYSIFYPNETEYSVLLDAGEGQLNIVGRVLEHEAVNRYKCDCGEHLVSWQKGHHARWCKLYQKYESE